MSLAAIGAGAGTILPGKPRPSATEWARKSSMWIRRDSTASRTRGVTHLLSSKTRAATMWSCSGLVWLAKNSRAWV
jgi:hypothetical protein